MVALNFQTPDLAMQLNQGKFEYNGNCGYVHITIQIQFLYMLHMYNIHLKVISVTVDINTLPDEFPRLPSLWIDSSDLAGV